MRRCDGRRFLRSTFGLSQKLQPFHRRQRFNQRPFQLRDDNGWQSCCMVSWFWFDRIIWIIQFQFIGKFLCDFMLWYVASSHVCMVANSLSLLFPLRWSHDRNCQMWSHQHRRCSKPQNPGTRLRLHEDEQIRGDVEPLVVAFGWIPLNLWYVACSGSLVMNL